MVCGVQLKESDPVEYKRIIDELRPAGEAGVTLPGTGEVLGPDGVKRKPAEEGMDINPVRNTSHTYINLPHIAYSL